MSDHTAEKDVRCPTCGATTWVQHPRLSDVLRCANCAEWQPTRRGSVSEEASCTR